MTNYLYDGMIGLRDGLRTGIPDPLTRKNRQGLRWIIIGNFIPSPPCNDTPNIFLSISKEDDSETHLGSTVKSYYLIVNAEIRVREKSPGTIDGVTYENSELAIVLVDQIVNYIDLNSSSFAGCVRVYRDKLEGIPYDEKTKSWHTNLKLHVYIHKPC